MMKTRTGDLFANVKPGDIIMHGCNAQGKMKSGFALEIRNRYPSAYNAYLAAFLDARQPVKLGDVIMSVGPQAIVMNCITQEFYGREPGRVYVNYDAVKKCAEEVAIKSKLLGIPVHLPMIGGGLANGDQWILTNIFITAFANTDATLWTKP